MHSILRATRAAWRPHLASSKATGAGHMPRRRRRPTGLFADADLPRRGLAFLQAHMTAAAIPRLYRRGPARLRGASARPRQDRGHRAADRALPPGRGDRHCVGAVASRRGNRAGHTRGHRDPAVHFRLHRYAQARETEPCQYRREHRGHHLLSRAGRRGYRDHLAQALLFLRHVCREHPSGRRGGARGDRSRHGQPRVLGAGPARGRDERRGRALQLRAAAPRGLRPGRGADPAASDPGRRAACPRPRARLRAVGARPMASTSASCTARPRPPPG